MLIIFYCVKNRCLIEQRLGENQKNKRRMQKPFFAIIGSFELKFKYQLVWAGFLYT